MAPQSGEFDGCTSIKVLGCDKLVDLLVWTAIFPDRNPIGNYRVLLLSKCDENNKKIQHE